MTLYDRCAGWTLPLLAGFLPLVFVPSFYDSFDLPRLVLISSVVVFLSILRLWDVWRLPLPVWRLTPVDGLLLAFVLLHGLSACFSIDAATSWRGTYRVYTFGVWPVAVAAVLFVLTVQCRHPFLASRIRLAILLSGAAAGLYAVLQVMGIEFSSHMPKVINGRPWSSLGNPLYLGTVCLMAFLVAWYEGLEKRRDRVLLVVCGLAHLAGLFLSLSRSAWVAAFVVLIIGSWTAGRRSVRWWIVPFFLVGALLLFPQTRPRLLSAVQLSEHSNSARVEGWKGAWRVAASHPLLGSGPDTFFTAFRPYRSVAYLRSGGVGQTQAHVHNDPLQMVSTLGVVGLGVYLALVVLFFRRSRPGPEQMVLAALLIHNLFNFSSLTTTAWAALLAALALPITDRPISSPRMIRPILLLAVLIVIGGALHSAGIAAVADVHVQQGRVWMSLQQPVRALVEFREATRLCPDIEVYQTELGNAARQLAQTAADGSLRQDLLMEAGRSAAMAVRYHPANPDAWNNQGVVAMWRNEMGGQNAMAEAKSSFEQAVHLDPNFMDAWANLAKWHHLAGDIDGEKVIWEKVLILDPSHEMANSVLRNE